MRPGWKRSNIDMFRQFGELKEPVLQGFNDFVEIELENGIVDSVQCLAQLPESKIEDITVCKVVGTLPTVVWDVIPLSVKDIGKATIEDKVLGKLTAAIRSGSINKHDADLKPFISLMDNLYVEGDVNFHGTSIIVPSR